MLTEIHKNWNTTVLFSWNYLHYNKKCDLFHWRAYSRWPVFSVCKAIIIQNKQGKPRGVPKADSNFSVWFLKTLTSQNVPIREYTGVTGGEKKLCCLAFTDWWGPPLPFIKVSQFQSMVCINAATRTWPAWHKATDKRTPKNQHSKDGKDQKWTLFPLPPASERCQSLSGGTGE